MKKTILIILLLWFIGSLSAFLQNAITPKCTYEYGLKWNTLLFEEACLAEKEKRSQESNEHEIEITNLKKKQSDLNEKNNETRKIQDDVARSINEVRKKDEYAFRKAE